MERMAETPQYASPAHLEKLLAALEILPGAANDGFFGPGSVTWRVNRESVVFLGAGRAALLQLAHPWVAAALAQHSNLLRDAIGRFHSTFLVIYTMLFGTRAQAVQASRQLHRRHTGIRGELPDAVGPHPRGEKYEANEVAALRWVYATLVESALLAYELVLPPLSTADREQYYLESKRMAALFGIPAEALPQDWGGFAQYTAEMLASPVLDVDAHGRALGESILSGAGRFIRPPRWYRALTASWLPERLRAAFGLPFNALEARRVKRAIHWLPRIYPPLPPPIRFVGPFHEATARLRGRPPGPITRYSNRFWMGQPRMLFPPR
jgi:uncharacterized protein (DUF2236 family)